MSNSKQSTRETPSCAKNFGANIGNKRRGLQAAKKKQNLFLFFFLLFPMVQFSVFYVGVNFNSFLLAFQSFEGGKSFFSGFENFRLVLNDIFVAKTFNTALINSLIQFALSLFLALPLQVIIAYAVFKKIPGSGFFKIMLFMPSMISSIVFVLCARVLITDGFPILFGKPEMNLLNPFEKPSFYTVLGFGYWFDLAGGLIIYLGAMASISQDVLEYGRLENLSSFQELIHVVIPAIFPTITTYILITFTSFFAGYGHLFSFYGDGGNKPYDTLGLIFFLKVSRSTASQSDLSYAAAGGILFTLIIAPATVLVRSLLEKYGPSED